MWGDDMTDFAGAVGAIKQRLRDHWTATPILFENEEPPAEIMAGGAAWIECAVLADLAEQRSIGSPGSNVLVDEGAIEITVFVPAGTGTEIAHQHAVGIADIFRNQNFYRDGEGRQVMTTMPLIGRGSRAESENPSGTWWAVAVTTPFSFYRLG